MIVGVTALLGAHRCRFLRGKCLCANLSRCGSGYLLAFWRNIFIVNELLDILSGYHAGAIFKGYEDGTMSNDIELHNKWLGGEKLEAVKFLHNDCVQIVAGPHSGERGSIVSIIRFKPNPSYIVETGSGKDIAANESDIEITNL